MPEARTESHFTKSMTGDAVRRAKMVQPGIALEFDFGQAAGRCADMNIAIQSKAVHRE